VQRAPRRREAAAGARERQLVGEVAVDGDAADAGAFGDLRDRRRRRADRLVLFDRRFDDRLARSGYGRLK